MIGVLNSMYYRARRLIADLADRFADTSLGFTCPHTQLIVFSVVWFIDLLPITLLIHSNESDTRKSR